MCRAASLALITACEVVCLASPAFRVTPSMVAASSAVDLATLPTLIVASSIPTATECMFSLTDLAESYTVLARYAVEAEFSVNPWEMEVSSPEASDREHVAATISESISLLFATMEFRDAASWPMASHAG